MADEPDELIPTRRSLLQRLKNWEDNASWKDFFDTYWRLIYGVVRKAGLNDAEAQDVVQETVVTVARQMPGFHYDPALGSFKSWLMHTTHWRIADHFRKKQYERDGQRYPKEERLDSTHLEGADLGGFDLEAAWNEEWEKHVLNAALAKVRERADPRQFQMFYMHVCKSVPARQVAQHLGAKLSEVYVAKYKLSAEVRKEVKLLEEKML